MGRGVWLPASLQEAMAMTDDLPALVKSEQFISDAEYWKKTNLESLFPPGGWPEEPQMHEDRSMQIKKSGVPLNVS